MSNLIPIQDFDRRNLVIENVKYQHPMFWFESYTPVTRSVRSTRFGKDVERAAEVVATTASLDDGQTRHLSGQLGFALCSKEFLKFPPVWGTCRQRVFER